MSYVFLGGMRGTALVNTIQTVMFVVLGSVALLVIGVGMGGFSVETMTPLETGVEHQVRFISRDDWSTTLAATIANSRPSCADDGSPLYVSGFSFAGQDSPEVMRTVQILIEKVTSVQLYGSTES